MIRFGVTVTLPVCGKVTINKKKKKDEKRIIKHNYSLSIFCNEELLQQNLHINWFHLEWITNSKLFQSYSDCSLDKGRFRFIGWCLMHTTSMKGSHWANKLSALLEIVHTYPGMSSSRNLTVFCRILLVVEALGKLRLWREEAVVFTTQF